MIDKHKLIQAILSMQQKSYNKGYRYKYFFTDFSIQNICCWYLLEDLSNEL